MSKTFGPHPSPDPARHAVRRGHGVQYVHVHRRALASNVHHLRASARRVTLVPGPFLPSRLELHAPEERISRTMRPGIAHASRPPNQACNRTQKSVRDSTCFSASRQAPGARDPTQRATQLPIAKCHCPVRAADVAQSRSSPLPACCQLGGPRVLDVLTSDGPKRI